MPPACRGFPGPGLVPCGVRGAGLLALMVAIVACTRDNPRWWRLACDSATTESWRVCNVKFFADDACVSYVGSGFTSRTSSGSGAFVDTYGSPVSYVYTAWASACGSCDRREPYFGVSYHFPVVVRCVSYESCATPAPVTLAPSSITPPPTFFGQAPAPAPTRAPTAAPSLSESPTFVPSQVCVDNPDFVDAFGKACSAWIGHPCTQSHPDAGGGYTTVQTLQVLNECELSCDICGMTAAQAMLAAIGSFRRLRGQQDSVARRLVGVGSASACTQVVLQRANDNNPSSWSDVAIWGSASPGKKLRLSGADWRPSGEGPVLLASEPSFSACGNCNGGSGVTTQGPLAWTFNKSVFPDAGHVKIVRPAYALGLTPQSIPLNDPDWVSEYGETLTLTPPTGESWGAEGSCTQLILEDDALSDADGVFYEPLLDGQGRTFCVKDTTGPELLASEPMSQQNEVALTPYIALIFREDLFIPCRLAVPVPEDCVVRITPNPAKSPETASATLAMVGEQVILDPQASRSLTIHVNAPLTAGTKYELQVDAGILQDKHGNKAPKFTLSFWTVALDVADGNGTGEQGPGSGTSSRGDGGTSPLIAAIISMALVGLVFIVGVGFLVAYKVYAHRRAEENAGLKASGDGSTAPPSRSATQTAGSAFQSETFSRTPSEHSPKSAATNSSGWKKGHGRTKTAPAEEETPQARPTPATSTSTSTPSRKKSTAGRSKEAEDNASSAPHGSRPTACPRTMTAEDAADSGGWVKAKDEKTGRPYWYHVQTRETRWEPPTKGASVSSSRPKTGGPGEKQKPEPLPSKLPSVPSQVPGQVDDNNESEDFRRVKKDLYEQLDQTSKEDIAARKKNFKFMCLKWHPDKNVENVELATDIFQWVQSQRDWYLKET